MTEMESHISVNFLATGLTSPGISYETTNEKLSIVIDSKKNFISESKTIDKFFYLGNECFWYKEKRMIDNHVEYIVSHIVDHGHDDGPSKKVSEVFPEISYADSIIVILT